MTGPQAADAPPPGPEENSAGAARDSTAKEPSNADDPRKKFADEPSSNTAGGGSEPASGTPTEDNSGAPRGPSVETNCKVKEVLNILDLRDETKKWLEENFAEQKSFEDFIQMSSEKVKDMHKDEGKNDDREQQGKNHSRFKQAERDKLILLRRWMKENKEVDGQEVKFKWGGFNRDSFDTFVNEDVPKIILDETLKELKFTEIKETFTVNGVDTPVSFVEKSKYWYKHEIKLSGADIHEIEKFKKWYKYQLDTHLPLDWIASFRKEATQVKELEWRKVLKAIGLKADAIQALEINDVCDFATLNKTSKTWWITKPSSSDSDWNEWEKMGLKENDARHVINFRHWHNFNVAGKKDKSDWAAEFNSAQYERFVHQYFDPSKPDEFKKLGWWALRSQWALRSDKPKSSKEKQEYYDILHVAAEDGVVTEKDRYHLRQYYKGRREKMELIQEINEGVGDSSFQEQRLGDIFEVEADTDRREKARELMFSQKFCQFFFCAMIAYVLLACWVSTGIVFMFKFKIWSKAYSYMNPKQTPVPTPSPSSTPNDYAVYIHNITFGLVTAVVIQELGEELKKTSVYHRFLPIYEELIVRLKKKRFRAELERRSRRLCCCGYWGIFVWLWEIVSSVVLRVLTWFILYSTRIHIFVWILFGAASLGYGIEKDLKPESPIYTTGQTWIGIAVTIAYSYFGLKDKNTLTIEDAKDAINQRIKDAVQRAIGGDGANGGEEAKFTNEKGETKVINTHHELMHEIDRYEVLRKKAEYDNKDKEASDYKKCLDRLEKLKPSLPTVEVLKSQLKEAQDKRAAVAEEDIDDEDKYNKEVIKLKMKLKEEKAAAAAAAGGDASTS